MTRADLVQRLRETAINMQDTSAYLEFFGGCSEAVLHAGELNGAAEMVGEWADELEKEGNVSATFPDDISRDSEKTC